MKILTGSFLIWISIMCIMCISCNHESTFNKKFIEHFPKNKANRVFYETSMNVSSNTKQYGERRKEGYKYEGSIKATVDTLKKRVENVVKYGDSCTIILPLVHYRNIDIGEPSVADCDKDYVVLSSFERIKNYQFIDDLNGYIFYILESEQGKFLKEEDLFDDNIMPNPWTHGYTKGFAISEQEKMVVFWIDIW
jgi:hypothetical protein